MSNKTHRFPDHPGMALPRPPLDYVEPQRIGACEWCGLVDHHLVEGECPSCKTKVAALAPDDDTPLGYEAADLERVVYGMPSLRRAVLGK